MFNNMLLAYHHNQLQWSDQGNIEQWQATNNNQAGYDVIEGAESFIAHNVVQDTIILFTDHQCWQCRYIGPPYIWHIEKHSDHIGIIAANAAIVVANQLYWLSHDGVYSYNGGIITLLDDPQEMVASMLSRLQWNQRHKIHATYIASYQEIWWFYPKAPSLEISHYVIYNIAERHWTMGEMARTAAISPPMGSYPLWCDPAGQLFRHEKGTKAAGSPLTLHATSSWFSDSQGSHWTELQAIFPDGTQQGEATLTIETSAHPHDSQSQQHVCMLESKRQKIDLLCNSRYRRMHLTATAPFRLGQYHEQLKRGTPA